MRPKEDPRTYYTALHNLLTNSSWRRERVADMASVLHCLDEAKSKLRRSSHSLPLLKLRWLEAVVRSHIDPPWKTEEQLRRCRERFVELGYMIDAAYVGLDLAQIYLDQGRHQDLAWVADECYQQLKSLGIQRSSLASLHLWTLAIRAQEANREGIAQVRQHLAAVGLRPLPPRG